MYELAIYDPQQVSFYRDSCTKKNFKIRKCAKGFQVETARKTIEVSAGQSIRCKNRILYCQSVPKSMSVLRLEKGFCLERKEGMSALVSKRHFQITRENGEYSLQDLSSSNGTYVNGRRISNVILRDRDHISAGGLHFLLYGDYLFCSHPIFESLIEYQPPLHTSNVQNMEEFEQTKAAVVEVELPSMMYSQKKTHWFSSIGPSLLILVSSAASAGAMVMRNPQDLNTVYSSLVTSMSMAAAFLGFGLINRKITWKESLRENERQRRLYEEYLQSVQENIHHMYLSQKMQMNRQEARLLHLDGSLKGIYKDKDWKIPISAIPHPAALLKYGKIRYDQKHDPLIVRLEKMEKQIPQSFQWVMLEGKGVYRLCSMNPRRRRNLFMQWSWMACCENRKWVWIDKDESEMAWHPACRLDQQVLHFACFEDFMPVFGQHPHLEYVIYCISDIPEADAIRHMEGVTWIFESDQPHPQATDLHPAFLDGEFYEKKCRISAMPAVQEFLQSGWDEHLLDKEAQAKDFHAENGSLAISLGSKAIWDLEKDGPHALIAGTTGSGKSEGLTTILLKLVLQNHPRHLQYILVDFKGGAFGTPFYQFPHCAGSMTNLKEDSFYRLEKAIDLELKARQEKMAAFLKASPFAQADINGYNQRHRKDPMSHLLIVVDECAQMLSMYPQSKKFLQETARIGRSLGVHLILSTQKLGGVIDEQILANANSRLCFRLNSAADSREILSGDAAVHLHKAGEFVLQVIDSHKEIRGKIPYCKASMQKGLPVVIRDEQQRKIWQHGLQIQPIEKISQLILTNPPQPDWILMPDLEEIQKTEDDLLLLDRIQTIEKWRAQKGKPAWLLASPSSLHKAARAVIADSHLPVVTLLFETQDADVVFWKENLWQLDQIERDVLCVCWVQEWMKEKDFARLLENNHLHMVFLSCMMEPAWQSVVDKMDLKICTDVTDREMLFQFCRQSHLVCKKWPEVWAFTGDEKTAGLFCQERKESRKRERLHFELLKNPVSKSQLAAMKPKFLLGFEAAENTPVFYTGNKPLLFVYLQPAAKRKVADLLEIWKMQDGQLSVAPFPQKANVNILELPEEQHLLNDPTGHKRLYDCQVIWVGKGFSDYQFAIRQRNDSGLQAEALLFDDGRCIPLNWVEITNEQTAS